MKSILSKTILIAGGGPAGYATLKTLVKAADNLAENEVLQIILIEPLAESEHGRGEAWASDLLELQIWNMPLPSIGSDSESIGEFAKLFRIESSTPIEAQYGSRRWIGEVLAQYAKETEKKAKSHPHIKFIKVNSEVEKIIRADTADRLTAICSNKESFEVDTIVAAIGNISSTSYKHIRGTPHYFPSGWNFQRRVSQLNKDSTVAIIGTSTTGCEVALVLKESGHRGNIYMLSQGGRLPGVRQRYAHNFKLKTVSKESIEFLAKSNAGHLNFEQIKNIVLTEFHASGLELQDFEEICQMSMLPAKQWLAVGLANYESENLFYTVAMAIDSLAPYLWKYADTKTKRWFKQHLATHYGRVMWPIAPPSAKLIYQMIDSRQLTVHGDLKSVSYDERESGFIINYADEEMFCDVVINAAGIGGRLTDLDSKLVQQMTQSGLLHPHEFGGALVDFDTGRVLKPDAAAVGPLWVTSGALNRGVLFVTNSLTESGDSGARAAQNVIEYLFPRRRSQ